MKINLSLKSKNTPRLLVLEVSIQYMIRSFIMECKLVMFLENGVLWYLINIGGHSVRITQIVNTYY